jgi:hypothetical protein
MHVLSHVWPTPGRHGWPPGTRWRGEDSVYCVLLLAHKKLAQAGGWRAILTDGIEPHGHKHLHGGVQETRHPQVDKPTALLLVRAPIGWPRQLHLWRNRPDAFELAACDETVPSMSAKDAHADQSIRLGGSPRPTIQFLCLRVLYCICRAA